MSTCYDNTSPSRELMHQSFVVRQAASWLTTIAQTIFSWYLLIALPDLPRRHLLTTTNTIPPWRSFRRPYTRRLLADSQSIQGQWLTPNSERGRIMILLWIWLNMVAVESLLDMNILLKDTSIVCVLVGWNEGWLSNSITLRITVERAWYLSPGDIINHIIK